MTTPKSTERLILLLLAAVQFTHIMDFMIMMPLGPQFMRELHIGPGQFSALVAAYTIASGVVGLLVAPWIDRYDRRTLLLIAYGGFGLGTLACTFAATAHQLMLARVISGAPRRRAANTSGTVSSTAVEITTICSALVTPEPSCGNNAMPFALRNSNFAAVRP